MEPMVTINLERYNKLLRYEDMIAELLEKSKKDVKSNIVPGWDIKPKKIVYIDVSKETLKSIYGELLKENKEDIKITLGD